MKEKISQLLYVLSPFATVKRIFYNNGYDKSNAGNNEGGRGSMSSNSTPYSQVSVPSSYDDYEDDFTSDEDSDGSMVNGNKFDDPK